MSTVRKTASRCLSAMIRLSPEESREWGHAMLREADFVEGNWPALVWALGSTAVLCRLCVSERLRTLDRKRRELSTTRIVRGVLPMLLGIVAAVTVLSICMATLSGLLHASWFDPTQQRLADRLLIVVVPETVYLASVLALWQRRKGFAMGILSSGLLLIAHAIIHSASHM